MVVAEKRILSRKLFFIFNKHIYDQMITPYNLKRNFVELIFELFDCLFFSRFFIPQVYKVLSLRSE